MTNLNYVIASDLTVTEKKALDFCKEVVSFKSNYFFKEEDTHVVLNVCDSISENEIYDFVNFVETAFELDWNREFKIKDRVIEVGEDTDIEVLFMSKIYDGNDKLTKEFVTAFMSNPQKTFEDVENEVSYNKALEMYEEEIEMEKDELYL